MIVTQLALFALFQNYCNNLPNAVCVNPFVNQKFIWSIPLFPQCTAHNVDIWCSHCMVSGFPSRDWVWVLRWWAVPSCSSPPVGMRSLPLPSLSRKYLFHACEIFWAHKHLRKGWFHFSIRFSTIFLPTCVNAPIVYIPLFVHVVLHHTFMVYIRPSQLVLLKCHFIKSSDREVPP